MASVHLVRRSTATPSALWRVVTDFAAYDRWMPLTTVRCDEGPPRAAPDLVHPESAPRHLAGAALTAESFGGRLMVADAPTHRYRLLLPRSEV